MARVIKVVIEMRGQSKVDREIKNTELAMKRLTLAQTRANAINKAHKASLDKLGKSASKMSFIQKRLTASYLAGNIAARAISTAVSTLTRVLAGGVKSAIDFEFSIAKISAISGTTGVQLQGLEDKIREIAKVSPKTATEVAMAALEMSKMGLVGRDLENSLAGVVNLSVALDEQVSAVGQTMVAVKNVFQKDATELTNIADMLFTTLGNSALNLEKFSTAFSFAGASARLAGVDFAQLSGLMGVLADNGIKASTIGTQLRQVFTKLDDSSSKVSNAIGKQSIKTIGLSATLRKLIPIIRESGDAKEFFGQRAISVIDILTKNIGKIERLTAETRLMTKSTADAAAILNDTMLGASKKVGSAWEEMHIKLSKIYSPAVIAGLNQVANLFNAIADPVDKASNDLEDFMAMGGGFDFSKPSLRKGPDDFGLDAVKAEIAARRSLQSQKDQEVADEAISRQERIKALAETLEYIGDENEFEKISLELLGKKLNFSKKIAELQGKLSEARKLGDRGTEKTAIEQILTLKKEDIQITTKAQTEAEKLAKQRLKTQKDEIKALEEKIKLKKEEESKAEAKVKVANTILMEAQPSEKSAALESLRQELAERLIVIGDDQNLRLLAKEAFLEKEKALEERFGKEGRKAMIANALAVASATQGLIGSFGTLASVRIENSIKTAAAEGELAAAGAKNAEDKAEIEEATAQKIQAMRKKGFELQKKFMIAQATMSTASGVARAFADYAFPMSAIVGGLVGAAGAVQIAAISSQKFAKGFDGVVNQPTNITVGEEGPEEVLIRPRGSSNTGKGGSGQGMTIIIQGDVHGEEMFLEKLRKGNEEIERRSA